MKNIFSKIFQNKKRAIVVLLLIVSIIVLGGVQAFKKSEKKLSPSDVLSSVKNEQNSQNPQSSSGENQSTSAGNNETTQSKGGGAKTPVTTKGSGGGANPAPKDNTYYPPKVPTNSAPGTLVYSNEKVVLDASNSGSGYIMIKYLGSNQKVKIMLNSYQFDCKSPGNFEAFPLTQGNGNYSVNIYENISGTSYSQAFSQSISVSLSSAFAPYLRPSQYVDYNASTNAVQHAANLCRGQAGELNKVTVIYNYVVRNFSYDYGKADTVQSGYLPDVSYIFGIKRGICFDYGAVITAMLRSQGIPTKLVVGYAADAGYHAWINVWTNEQGWINGVIYFNGNQWKLMDPTFASTGKESSGIMEYIKNTGNYSPKYYY